MRIFQLLVFGLFLSVSSVVQAAPPADVLQYPACHKCGMDRGKFSHSRMLIEHKDGLTVATCSLHCASAELADTTDKLPVLLRVADYDSKELINADKAIWVIGGNKHGVMTRLPKWAFGTEAAARSFIAANGGSIASWAEAQAAAREEIVHK